MIYMYLSKGDSLDRGFFFTSSSVTSALSYLDQFYRKRPGVLFEVGDIPDFTPFSRYICPVKRSRPKQLNILEEAL